MRSKLRTLFAMLLAVAMFAGLCIPAYAEIGTSGRLVEFGAGEYIAPVTEEPAEEPAEEEAVEEAEAEPDKEAEEAPAAETEEAPAEEAEEPDKEIPEEPAEEPAEEEAAEEEPAEEEPAEEESAEEEAAEEEPAEEEPAEEEPAEEEPAEEEPAEEEPAEEEPADEEEPAEEEPSLRDQFGDPAALINAAIAYAAEHAAPAEDEAAEEAPAEDEAAEEAPVEEAVEEEPAEEEAAEEEAAEEEPAEDGVETAEGLVEQITAGLEETEEEAADGKVAYIMYADANWANQYWYDGNEYPVTAVNACVNGAGAYTVGLTFDAPAEGLAFAALGIDGGETAFPEYTIEVTEIRVNGEPVEFGKGYTSSDDGVTMRMNLYNEWVSELPADARSFDGSIEGATPTPVNRDDFASVTSVEVDFVLHRYALDTAYIMFANADWSVSYWGGDAPEGVTAENATIEGPGDYTVALTFDAPSEGLAFTALGVVNGEKTLNGAFLRINEIRLNGEAIEFGKGYTSSDDGITTRMNIFNEWVGELPADARSWDGTTEDASWIIVDPALFTGVTSFEIDFTVVPVTDVAYLMYANADWSVSYWGGDAPEGVTTVCATVDGPGTYTVGLAFDEPSAGLAFTAVGVTTGEQTFPGYFIDITDIKVNGESIPVQAGYTSSDDGVCTRENIYNEWVSDLPDDARRADGELEGASPIIVDLAAFESVTSIEVTFDYIYGKAEEKDANAPLTEEEAAELLAADYNAYIGVQTTSYIFRNSWDEANYGRDSADNPGFFDRLTGWDADNNAVDYGGTFIDAELTEAGTYFVSLTTSEMGFGSDETFRLLFVSTDIPSALVRDGFLEITDVQTQIGDAAPRAYTDIDTSGTYVRIVIIDEYNRSEAPFGYTVPGADATITVTFTVSGLTE